MELSTFNFPLSTPPLKAVIIAGGEGARIQQIAQGVPKPLLDVGGHAVVEHQIRLLRRYGIREIHLTVRADDLLAFRQKLGDGQSHGVSLRYQTENDPLGTAGAVASLTQQLGDFFFVLYGDVMVNMDLSALAQFHQSANAAATLVVHPTEHPHDSDLVGLDADSRIRAFHPKPRPPQLLCRNVANAGLYVLSRAMADFIPAGASDFMRDVFPAALAAGAAVYGYCTREYLRDMGTPQRLLSVRADWDSGHIERRHRDFPLPAIFFDRDGTICEYVPLLGRVDQVRLLSGVAAAIRRINQADCLAVVVTNQPVVAQGLCTIDELERIHARLEMLLGEQGAKVDAIYYCPHHPDAGHPGEVRQLKIACECRKPSGEMLRRAARDLNIDLSRSAIVGDSTRDIETGHRLGLRTVLVQTGKAGRDGKFAVSPDVRCSNVAEAVDFLLCQMR